jgi:DNA-binding helix-turn-helix protein
MVKQQRDIELMQKVGTRLRVLRETAGLSQEKVLFQTGVYLTRIENGHRNINISTLIELCKTYKVSVYEFFKGIEQNGEAQPK